MNICQQTMEHRHHGKHCCNKGDARQGVFFGLTLVAVGGLFLLEHLNMLGGFSVMQFWPGLFAIWGLRHLTKFRSLSSVITGVVMLTGASLGLVHTLEIAVVPWNLIWPGAVILLGLIIVLCMLLYKPSKHSFVHTLKNGVKAKVVMGGYEEVCDAPDFDGGEISVTMGAYELDLRNAKMSGQASDLSIRLAMGEVKIKVPHDWRVDIKGSPVMGSIENKTGTSIQDPDCPILNIQADVALGSLEIYQ